LTDEIRLAAPIIGPNEIEAVERVLRSGMLAQGPEVAAFEAEFAAVAGGGHAIAVNSGTSALLLGLLAAGVEAGHEVIVPSFTFAATANAVVLAGGSPVFVDIDPDTFCIDPTAIEAAITERTRAVIPVHLYGHPANMTAISAIAKEHNLLVLEDAAQAHLAAIDGRPVGSFGDVAAFSFYPTKNMTTGEGGMVVTRDETIATRVRLLRNQGMEQRYRNEIPGYNMRMTDIQAAIGREQLKSLPNWTSLRQGNARVLDGRLAGVEIPHVQAECTHVYHQYTVRVPGGERDRLAEGVREQGIGCDVYYPVPVHRLPAFGLDLDLPETDRAAREVLSLPVHPGLTERQLETIATSVNAIVESTQ